MALPLVPLAVAAVSGSTGFFLGTGTADVLNKLLWVLGLGLALYLLWAFL